MSPPRSRRARLTTKPSLLILQLDSAKLCADGLDLSGATSFAARVASIVTVARVETLTTTTEQDLLDELARLAEQGAQFDVVVAIGHSNETGIRVACDRFAPWEAFAAYLKPFAPRRLMLVACEAGRWPAADVLFTKLYKLRRIFASPVRTSKDVGTLMLAVVPYLVEVKAPRTNVVRASQVAFALIAGGQVRQWMRDHDKGNPDRTILDFLSDVADPFVRQLPKLLSDVLR